MSAHCHVCGFDLPYEGPCSHCKVIAERDEATKGWNRTVHDLQHFVSLWESAKERIADLEADLERAQGAAVEVLTTLEGYLQGESGLPFTEPYGAARKAAEYLRHALAEVRERGEQ